MSLLKKIIYGFIFLILFYILFRLIKKRTDILKETKYTEGLSTISTISNVSVKKIMTANLVNEITENLSEKTYYNNDSLLNMYHIKSSYNSAYSGKDISTDMVLYILHRGYRFLDFEIYYDYPSEKMANPNNTPIKKSVVAFADGSTTSKNNLELKDILEVIHLNAFSNASNNNDPLFIQIRPMYNIPTSKDTVEEKNKKIISYY